MTDRTRCRKGDMKIDIQGIEVRVTTFVNRDTVRQAVRDRIAARIPYLQHLSATIGHLAWPQSFDAWLADRPAPALGMGEE